MTTQTDLTPVFNRLKEMLLQAPDSARVIVDDAGHYSLNTPYSTQYKKELFLGAVQIKKNYVSYYLMPVYMQPALLEGISPRLEKRRQGKSCFNFKTIDEELFQELESLTRLSIAWMKQAGYLP